ncbi:MAG: hypothetical protein GY906_03045 [bacterium]|nr:hypothetical protein [bacterium]
MEIKGVSVKSAPTFVQNRFPSQYDEWLTALSPTSREIVESVLLSRWYPLQESFIEPTQKLCDLFFEGSEDGAWEVGRTSAEFALGGVYGFFIKLGSPEFILTRVTTIFSNMVRPGEMKVAASSHGAALLEMSLPESDRLLEARMAAWMEQALIISGCSNPRLTVRDSITEGAPVTEFSATWTD